MENKVVTRFAPSPTGYLHIGGARVALFNYLFARNQGGQFILRIEDTDKERSKKEYAEDIEKSLAWMGLDYDEKVMQSEMLSKHQQEINKLIENGFAYKVTEQKKEGSGEIDLVRFKNPKEVVKFNDLVRGEIEMETESLGDFVIAKDDMQPLYHLSVVVDDAASGVTHIIRGEDHISNTARQILLQKALSYATPQYAHISLTVDIGGKKLSKRDDSLAVHSFVDVYLPDAFANFLALLGWNPKDDSQEIFTLKELVKIFDISKFQKSSSVYDVTKLNWVQSSHIKNMELKEFVSLISTIALSSGFDEDQIDKIAFEAQQRVSRLDEVGEILGEFDFVKNAPNLALKDVVWKETSIDDTKVHLGAILGFLEPLEADKWTIEGIKSTIWGYADEKGRGEVLWPFRYALTGMDKSPDPFSVAYIIGKEETLSRIRKLI